MFLDSLSSVGSSFGVVAADRGTIADNFDTFLQLLTTQLKNQNPLDPLDTNQFTQQLVQFSGVEQQIKSNDNLEMLVKVLAANAATSAVNFIGNEVTVRSTVTNLADGSANWQYRSAGSTDSATFTIRDSQGNVVRTETRSLANGPGAYSWNGRDDDGNVMPDGAYGLTIEGHQTDGTAIPVIIEVAATIDGVDFSGTEPLLLVGDKALPLGDVSSVKSR